MLVSTIPILQFGTSRFLQAHADLFVSEAMVAGEAIGPIAVVQSSGDPARAQRVRALAKGYDVRLRGLRDGDKIDETVRVKSIARAFSLSTDRVEVSRLLATDARIVVSNTSEAGLAPQPADRAADFDDAMSYPAKLACLLRERFAAGGEPIQVMPTELVRNNGQTLRNLVLDAASEMDEAYRAWLREEVAWVNSLVDRIVSEAIEPAGAVAEPYALWAIEDRPGLLLPCRHPAIQVVADLGPIERRKLFILNLGHTWMVSRWLARGRQGATFVRDLMTDREAAGELAALYSEEVLPGFVAAGEGEGTEAYIHVTMERFANPFLDHRLEDIAQNHGTKLGSRLSAFLDWARLHGDRGAKPRLAAALEGPKA
ncbi:mannitol dehydrogenase family protein [Fulvimarina manganoxydans]|uniref:mannitol dehydrogenase family protein n=1 Tax=Fulvimarina manganoxydans TaxID=937218 RepID=UPI00235359E0|nr:mannitol dehydrogenase family protein [Fulvimarina manganoxydans]